MNLSGAWERDRTAAGRCFIKGNKKSIWRKMNETKLNAPFSCNHLRIIMNQMLWIWLITGSQTITRAPIYFDDTSNQVHSYPLRAGKQRYRLPIQWRDLQSAAYWPWVKEDHLSSDQSISLASVPIMINGWVRRPIHTTLWQQHSTEASHQIDMNLIAPERKKKPGSGPLGNPGRIKRWKSHRPKTTKDSCNAAVEGQMTVILRNYTRGNERYCKPSWSSEDGRTSGNLIGKTLSAAV